MHIFSAVFVASFPLAVFAQSAQQNATAAALAAQIPACVHYCDEDAIKKVGCSLTDYACHCAHGSQLASLIPPCLSSNSTCSPDDLKAFAAIPPKICAALNGTTSTNTTTTPLTSSGSATATHTPSGPTSASSTAIMPSNRGLINSATPAMFGFIGTSVLGALLSSLL